MSFLRRVAVLCLSDRVRSSRNIWERLTVEAAAPPHWEELDEVVHVVRMLAGHLPCVLSMPIQEETPGQTEDMLERLYLSAGLGTSWCPSGRVGRRDGGEEHLEFFAQAVAPATQNGYVAENETKQIRFSLLFVSLLRFLLHSYEECVVLIPSITSTVF